MFHENHSGKFLALIGSKRKVGKFQTHHSRFTSVKSLTPLLTVFLIDRKHFCGCQTHSTHGARRSLNFPTRKSRISPALRRDRGSVTIVFAKLQVSVVRGRAEGACSATIRGRSNSLPSILDLHPIVPSQSKNCLNFRFGADRALTSAGMTGL
jgi:hypothetical protein